MDPKLGMREGTRRVSLLYIDCAFIEIASTTHIIKSTTHKCKQLKICMLNCSIELKEKHRNKLSLNLALYKKLRGDLLC